MLAIFVTPLGALLFKNIHTYTWSISLLIIGDHISVHTWLKFTLMATLPHQNFDTRFTHRRQSPTQPRVRIGLLLPPLPGLSLSFFTDRRSPPCSSPTPRDVCRDEGKKECVMVRVCERTCEWEGLWVRGSLRMRGRRREWGEVEEDEREWGWEWGVLSYFCYKYFALIYIIKRPHQYKFPWLLLLHHLTLSLPPHNPIHLPLNNLEWMVVERKY